MSGRDSRLGTSLTRMTSAVLDVELALADGWQPHDQPVIVAAVRLIKAEFLEVEDVDLDIKAIRRACTVGRHRVFDERFRARDNDLRGTRSHYRGRQGTQERAATRLRLMAAGEVERATVR